MCSLAAQVPLGKHHRLANSETTKCIYKQDQTSRLIFMLESVSLLTADADLRCDPGCRFCIICQYKICIAWSAHCCWLPYKSDKISSFVAFGSRLCLFATTCLLVSNDALHYETNTATHGSYSEASTKLYIFVHFLSKIMDDNELYALGLLHQVGLRVWPLVLALLYMNQTVL